MTDSPADAPRPRRSAAAALDALIDESSAPAPVAPRPMEQARVEPPAEASADSSAEGRASIVALLAAVVFLVGFAGVLTDAVAASQLLAGSGASALGIVWPIGGVVLLATAAAQASFVDRLRRRLVLSLMGGGLAVLLLVALVLGALDVPSVLPAAFGWIAADQINFLVPLVVWSYAGDLFTAGEGVVVFPRISRWWFLGQASGLTVATLSPTVMTRIDVDVIWLIGLPLVCCAAVAALVWRLPDPVTGAVLQSHSTSLASAISDTVEFIRDLRAFGVLWRMSLLVMAAGVAIEFGFLDAAGRSFDDAGSLQTVYAGMSLAGFVACWLVQSTGLGTVVQRKGIAASLLVLPVAALLANALLLAFGVGVGFAAAAAGLLAWRIPRWSIDATARQAALATVPDHRRTRVSFLTELAPWSIGLCVVAVPVWIGAAIDASWPAPAFGIVLTCAAAVFGRQLVAAWDETQLSYRLKRRRRAR